jgi:hypothetical protein
MVILLVSLLGATKAIIPLWTRPVSGRQARA